jgi:hypothetical protein
MLGDLVKGDLVRHETFGLGRVEDTVGIGEGQKCLVHFPRNEKTTYVQRSALAVLSPQEETAYEMVKLAVRELRREEAPAVGLGNRWQGGEFILKPSDPELSPHVIPIETFFHKIVMVRDRLRVMEQQINGSDKLTDEEKVGLQQYITRIYGSLTSFNLLFKNKQDHFVGQKGAK